MAYSDRLPSLAAVVIIVGGAAAGVTSPGLLYSPDGRNIINGEWTLAYEKNFDQSLSVREASISFWANLQYFLFGEGRPGVLVGSDDWLFTTEEFSEPPDGAAETARKLEFIKDVQDRLEAAGSELIVALLPGKGRVYPEHLGRYGYPAAIDARYSQFREALISEGVNAPDILTALKEAKDQGQLYLRTDTHWTPLGAAIAAKTIALAATKIPWRSDPVMMETTTPAPEPFEGDLLSYLPLGLLAPLGPQPDTLAEPVTVSTAISDLFSDVTFEVALVGTSYSANEKWNFAGALANELQREVLNQAAVGRGPIFPMLEYLRSDDFKDSPPSLVIWEMPERFLPVTYDMTVDNEVSE